MKIVRVNASKEYKVLIGADILDRAGEYIYGAAGGSAAAVVTDDIVSGLYLERTLASLRAAGYDTSVFTIRNGETSKNAYTYIKLAEHLADKRLARSDVIIALGGGVVGDLAGFAAATYMRGISFAQIPTTLLAAVDSSVGGKTAIDLEAGKNLVGAFYQPDAVICDVTVIERIPPRVYTDGCAEVIKYGMIADSDLLHMLDSSGKPDIEDIITRCVTIKRDIVCKDEFESGERKLLNFGHTVGHAVEQLSNYKISHGRAVAIGMAVETMAAVKMRMCGEDCYRGLIDILHRHGLPYNTRYSAEELARAALSDKKRKGDKLTLIMPRRPGKCIMSDVKIEDLESVIALGLDYEH